MKSKILSVSFFTIYCILILLISCGGGSKSSGAGAGGSAGVAGIPTGLTASQGTYTDQVELTWAAVDGADSYVIYKSIDSDNQEEFQAIAIDVKDPAFKDESVSPNRNYYYRVSSSKNGTWSDPSDEALGYATTDTVPSAPGGATTAGSSDSSSVTITWSPETGAVTYNVYRSENPDGSGAVLVASGLTSTSYTDTNVTPGTTYYYSVTSVNYKGESEQSSVIAGNPTITPPDVPSGFSSTATNNDGTVVVTWAASEGALSYNLYRSESADGTQNTTVIYGLTELTYTDTNVNGTYYYSVAAVNLGGEGAKTAFVSGSATIFIPETPAGLTASNGNADGTVVLAWNSVPGEVKYKLYRSDSADGANAVPLQGGLTATGYTDTGVNKTYYYAVAAGNGKLESAKSAFVTGSATVPPDLEQPMPPSKVTATSGLTTGQVELSWTTVTSLSGTISYNVYRFDGTSYNLLTPGGTKGTTYVDAYPAIVVGESYYYYVTAVAAQGDKTIESEPGQAVIGSTLLATPANLNLSLKGAIVQVPLKNTCIYQDALAWDPVIGAKSYMVKYIPCLMGQTPSEDDWNSADVITFSSAGNSMVYANANAQNELLKLKLRHFYRVQALYDSTSFHTKSAWCAAKYIDNPILNLFHQHMD